MTTTRLSMLFALLVAGCGGGSNNSVCTQEFRAGIILEIQDPAGHPICDATITAVDGTYKETLATSACGTYSGAGERAGVYTVTIEKTGFQTDTLSIGVTKDECHVHTEQRNLTLTPQ